MVFRICFGLLLLYTTLRTWTQGWAIENYVDPKYHFQFFEWMPYPNGQVIELLFYTMGITSVFISIGLLFRWSTLFFLFSFIYVELLDKTYYLNHYYLVTLLVFWLLISSAHRRFSVDALIWPRIYSKTCPQWQIAAIKVQLSIVYFFAGWAKVNKDWLLSAQPLATWLPGRYQIPIIGSFLHLKSVAFLFSWVGCLYDLTIWFFLWVKKTRPFAYVAVVIFHILTGILFPRIGMFPYIMMTSGVIFFSADFHEKLLAIFERKREALSTAVATQVNKPLLIFLYLFLSIQVCMPLRYLFHSGNIFWNEKGYRLSWRVMLMEKNGFTSLIVKDPVTQKQWEVDQDEFLTPFQKQQMRSQPDMILQFAHFLGDHYTRNNVRPEVYIQSRMSLNGRRSQRYTNEKLDVYNTTNLEDWIIPLDQHE